MRRQRPASPYRADDFFSAEGQANSSIAERLELGKATVGKWRARFIERRVAGLYDDVRRSSPVCHARASATP